MSASRIQDSDYDEEDEAMDKIPARFRDVVKPPKNDRTFCPTDYWWD